MKARPWELGLACLAIWFAVMFSVCDWSWWHPGFNNFDEEIEVVRAQLWREGYALPMIAFQGCLGRLSMALSCAVMGPNLSSLHLPVVLGFLLECLLLATLAQRLFSQRAAVWAVVVNCICAFTLMRARTLLMYAFLPLEWLILLLLLPHASKRFAAFAWGLAASALLLDYEAWALGLVALSAAFWFKHRGTSAVKWAFFGVLLGSAVVAALSWKMIAGHVIMRLAMTTPKGAGDLASSALKSLKSYWMGGDYLYFIAANGQPAFPVWAVPLLLIGLIAAWKRWKQGLVWIVVGFLPFILARGSAAEPQRAMLAWPALCLFAGLGAEIFWSWRPRLAVWVLPALCLTGLSVEGHAYLKSIHEHYVATYGDSANFLTAVKALKQSETGPRRFITELNHKSGAPIRFLLANLKQSPDSSEVVAFVPWEYEPGMKGDWGRRESIASRVSDEYTPPVLLYPTPDKIRRLDAIEAELRPLWSEASLDGVHHVRESALSYLDSYPKADPWVRTACWESFLDMSMILRQVPRQRVAQAMKEPLLSATFYEWMTRVSLYEDRDPSLPLKYASAALKLDPRRENSKKLFQQAQQRAKLAH